MNSKSKILFILLCFAVITLFLNHLFIKEIIQNYQYRSFGGDTVLTQYFGEWFYRQLVSFKNPFSYNNTILYPFGTPTVFAEGGFINSLFFLFLRPFFSIYTTLLIIVLLALFLAAMCMYALLRTLKVSNFMSFLFALVYAFAPFVSVRIATHFNYVYHYLFPLNTLLLLLVLKTKHEKKSLFFAILFGFTVSLLVYNTFYYLIIYALFVLFFLSYYLFFNRNRISKIVNIYKSKIKFLVLSGVVAFLILLPFISSMLYAFQIKDHRGQPHGEFPGGTIEFSAKPIDILLPSEFNPFLGQISKTLRPDRQPTEQIIYPGGLVLFGVLLFLLGKNKKKLIPLFATGFTFYILSLGPFLGKVPLPYVFVHKLPFLSEMRSPVRYGFMISFAGVLLAAQMLDARFKKIKKYKIAVIVALLLILLLDQTYIANVRPKSMQLPLRSYKFIKADLGQGAVMELPYSIQDGFLYQGRVFHSYPMIGQLIHSKPIIGGYLARINPYKLNYYMSDPFLSYYGALVDDFKKEEDLPKKPQIEDLQMSADFLNIRYLLVREDLPKYDEIAQDMIKMKYKKLYQNDNGFTFFIKPEVLNETKGIIVGEHSAQRQLFGQWSKPEQTHRWIDGTHAGILFNLQKANETKISFKASAYKIPRSVSVYINGSFQKKFLAGVESSTYSFSTKEIKAGINKMDFVVSGKKPSKTKAEDQRNLSLSIAEVIITH